MGTVGHDNEARFFTHQAIFDHHTCAGAADAVVPKHGVHRGMRFGSIRGDDDPFAGGEAVGLDDDRRAASIDVCMGARRIRERLVRGGWNAMPHHESLGKILGALQARSVLCRAENVHACLPEWKAGTSRCRRTQPTASRTSFSWAWRRRP